jgi:integrase
MAKVLTRLGAERVTVHGFRSAFRDWAGNETHFARELAEAALAPAIGDKAEQAYRRGDALEKRRALMTAWQQYIRPERTMTSCRVSAFPSRTHDSAPLRAPA